MTEVRRYEWKRGDKPEAFIVLDELGSMDLYASLRPNARGQYEYGVSDTERNYKWGEAHSPHSAKALAIIELRSKLKSMTERTRGLP